MTRNSKSSASLLLAGLAAFAIYKYKKMTPEKKVELKVKGKELLHKYVPDPVRNFFNNKENMNTRTV